MRDVYPQERSGLAGRAQSKSTGSAVIAVTEMPVAAEVLSAVILAMTKVKRLAKSDRNEVEGYAFSSIDSFLDLVNPICAEVGLLVLMQEAAVIDIPRTDRGKTEDWVRISYDISLVHVSGQSLGPFRRHVDIARTGPQAFGAAQSYVLKQFLRAQFQIATGERDDPDFGTRLPADAPRPAGPKTARPAAVQAKSSAASPKPSGPAAIARVVQSITQVSSGRDLLALLARLSGESRNHATVVTARQGALRRIVAAAPSDAVLDKLQAHFSEDWPQLADLARARRAELRGTPADDPADTPASGAASAEVAAPPGPGTPDAIPTSASDTEFGDIPYSEVAA